MPLPIKLIAALAASSLLLTAQSWSPTHEDVATDQRIAAIERQLRDSPDNPKLQLSLISSYLQKLRETGDPTYFDRASRLVDRLSEKDGGSYNTLRLRNEIDLQRHDFKAVAARARSMSTDQPSDPGNWGNLGDALMELGEYDAAGQAYGKMFAIRPSLASYNRLAFHRFVTGDAPGSIAFMRMAVEAGDATPEHTAWCQAELGDMYFKTGKYDEARSAYNAALDLFPGLHRAYAGLGKVEAALGQNAAAVRDYERAQATVPLVEYAGALENLYRLLGQTQKAEAQRKLLDALDTLGRASKETTNRNLAIIFANQNRRLDRALELIQAELPVRGDVYTWDADSLVLLKLGRIQEAREASRKALRMNTPEPDFYRHAAQIAEAAGDSAAAAQYRARFPNAANEKSISVKR